MVRPGGVAVLVALAVAGTAIVGVAVTADVGTHPVLVVETANGSGLLAVPVESGATVTLEYTHSVEKTTVRDVYEVRDGRLVMTYMEFSSFGAGLPSEADVERTEEGTFIYHPPDRRTGDLLVATGRIAGHELIVDGTRYDLVGLADAGTVRIHVEQRITL